MLSLHIHYSAGNGSDSLQQFISSCQRDYLPPYSYHYIHNYLNNEAFTISQSFITLVQCLTYGTSTQRYCGKASLLPLWNMGSLSRTHRCAIPLLGCSVNQSLENSCSKVEIIWGTLEFTSKNGLQKINSQITFHFHGFQVSTLF